MLFNNNSLKQSDLRDAITAAYRSDETIRVNDLLKQAIITPTALTNIQARAE
ncbi:MAG: hypothetical protein JO131_07035, partial [Gammaproteobacteria bacterium]|nr:hypothetical protein [Gammaproteobacteria bacterium]